MEMKKLCMIGSGNMGKAMVRGILKTGLLKPEEIVMTDLNAYVVEDLQSCFWKQECIRAN